ncbi:MAG: N-acetylglucosamine-6-phosphate deacetylase [Eubacterium sp.]|nr:N-acetylglucosamine-6-phosphate deacetylase [Eubacterium sp.]
MILKNCTFFNEEFEKEYADIKIENGKITEIGIFPGDGRDMSSAILLPGFIDIHIHGASGGDASDCDEDSLNKMSKFLASRGVTSFCPTAMTASIEKLEKIEKSIVSYKGEAGAKIAGINLEGPFISKEKCGSQNTQHITPPSKEAFDRLYTAGDGLLKLITVAPEECKGDFVEYAAKKCRVSVGHTNADYEACKKALENGAKNFTHLYNAMTPITHRSAGAVGAALDSEAMCELICDGFHICPAVIRNTFKILGENRAVAVSDSMRAAGLGEGEYELGGQRVFVNSTLDVARLENGTIAASVTNLFDEFKNLISFGIDFKTALKACTINPARAIDKDNKIGSIAIGKCADFTIIDEELNLKGVIINGAFA